MKRFIRSGIASGLLALSGLAVAAETGPVVQAFTCDFRDGTTMEDFWAVADQFRATMAGLDGPGLDSISVFALLPMRTAAPADLLWLVGSPNLNALGQGLTTYYGSDAGVATDAAFGEIAECDSGVAFYEQVWGAPPGDGDGDATDREQDSSMEIFACNLLPGKTAGDLQDATAFWQQQMGKIDSDAVDQYSAWLWTPYRGSGEFDFVFVGAYPDLVTHMQSDTDYLTSKAGQAADARFAALSRCDSGLWRGYGIFQRNPEGGQ